jgi:creatinine amidohydrolase/Fe(II)-dependent formamide hydrolase-like protein
MQFNRLFHIKSSAAGLALALLLLPVAAALAASDYLDDLTTSELRERIAAGATTVLVPIGGTEQSGPYIALGKHNVRARLLAGQIAQRLGNTLVAPVISYVPEGSIHPPAGHMRFAGTISIPDGAFEAMLEGTVRSLKQHGVREVFLLADHGGYTRNLEHVATRLNREWAKDPSCHVHALPEYYQAASTGFGALLKKRGFSDAEVGVHAGLADTSLTLALDKSLVRADLLKQAAKPAAQEGVNGDPRRATAELGQLGVQLIVDDSVAAIRKMTATDAGK